MESLDDVNVTIDRAVHLSACVWESKRPRGVVTFNNEFALSERTVPVFKIKPRNVALTRLRPRNVTFSMQERLGTQVTFPT